MPKIQINNIVRDMTSEEEEAYNIQQAKALEEKQAEQDAKTALEANRASGKTKLKTGEALNDAEVSALFGD